MKRSAFILGCERSGTTWLANMVDSHPRTMLFMEPFAPFARLFPSIPNRNVYVARPDERSIAAVRAGFTSLEHHKYPLLYRPGRPRLARRLDDAVMGLGDLVARGVGRHSPPLVGRARLLNLHLRELPLSQHPRKAPEATLLVTKELRLNFKVRLLAEAFPDARFVAVIRDPAAEIASIMRFRSRGGLRELASALKSFFGLVANEPALARYQELVKDADSEQCRERSLLIWWAVNYDRLLRDLSEVGAESMVVRHEELAAAPGAVAQDILAFLGLPTDRAVERFVGFSSSTAGDSEDPLDIRRESAEYARSRIESADDSLRRELNEISRTCDLVSTIASYVSDGRTPRLP